MVTASFINRLSHAIDVIEMRTHEGKPYKIVKIRHRYDEDPHSARERHYASHPEDRGAEVVLFEFYED